MQFFLPKEGYFDPQNLIETKFWCFLIELGLLEAKKYQFYTYNNNFGIFAQF